MAKSDKYQDEIKKVGEEIIDLTGVKASLTVKKLEEGIYEFNLDSPEETGLIIGFRGENIESLQTVIASIIKQRTGEWLRILVNIGDYRKKQEEKIESLAVQAIDRAIQTKQPQPIYNLNSSQRRVIHLLVSKRDDCLSESQGEGEDRYIVITPK